MFERNIYVVLGMARSGTSVIARSLKTFGIDLGEQLKPKDSRWNAKGFWEDTEIVYKINRRLLDELNEMMSFIGEFPQTKYLLQLKQSAIKLLENRFAHTQHWGFKDPRTAKLLPFWQDIFKTLDLNEHYIIALRNPLASAYSYQRVTGTDLEIGLLLWLMHLIPAIDHTRHKKRIMMSYELLLENPQNQLTRLKNNLNLPFNLTTNEYIHEFLDKKLQHCHKDEKDLALHSATKSVPICIEMYHLLMQVAQDQLSFESDAFHLQWGLIKNEFEKMHPVYCYLDKVLKQKKQLAKELRTIRKSIPWKLIFPLRFFDDLLRLRRQRRRKSGKLKRC